MTRPARGREKRWVVREGDGATVGAIVARAGESEGAIDEGRVFVGRVRAKSAAQPVQVGDEVRIGAGAGAGVGAAAAVIWRRHGLLACDKPAGIPTVADHGGAAHSLVALAAAAVGRKAEELFVTSRLDREVSGVVVFAMWPEAEARLKKARAEGQYKRRYIAIAPDPLIDGSTLINIDQPNPPNQPRRWDAPIGAGRDPRHRAAFGPDAKPAVTHFRVVARAGGFAMLAVEPQTGRTHQIRVHASHAGAPLLGDRDYGGVTRTTIPSGRVIALSRIALHAARVTVPDSHGAPLVAEAPIPPELAGLWSDLGGASEAWDTASSCALEA